MAVEFSDQTRLLAQRLTQRGQMLATAESCTGGWVAKACIDQAGSSSWFERGFVTYSNAAKTEQLGVSPDTLARHGAVSEPVVREMVRGVLANSRAQWALSISGIAGPGGGSPGKPVGTVWFGWAGPDEWLSSASFCFDGDRDAVRQQAVVAALRGLLDRLESRAEG